MLVGGDRVGVPITLAVGDVTATVDVAADAPLLQTESTTLGQDLNNKAVADLPLGGQRVFTYLARLSPGVVKAEPGARDEVGGGFSANGVRSNGQNNFLLNGVDNNVNVIDFLNQTAFVVGPSVEAIGEMRILTNGYNAEYGRGAGGVVNVNLKSRHQQLAWRRVRHFAERKAERQPVGITTRREEIAGRSNRTNSAAAPAFLSSKTGSSCSAITRARASVHRAAPSRISGTVVSTTIPLRHGEGRFLQSLFGGVVGTDATGGAILKGAIYDPKTQRALSMGNSYAHHVSRAT